MKKLLVLLMLMPINIFALSMSINCPQEAYVGEEFTCKISANNSSMSGAKYSILYSGLDYISSSNNTGSQYYIVNNGSGDGTFEVAYNTKNLASYKLKGNSVGTYLVSVTCINIIDGENFLNHKNCGVSTANISIKEKPITTTTTTTTAPTEQIKKVLNTTTTKNVRNSMLQEQSTTTTTTTTTTTIIMKKEAYLTNIKIVGYTINFLKDKYEYDLELASDVFELYVEALTDDDSFIIENTGLINISGKDNIKIIVKNLEDDTKQTYTINLKRFPLEKETKKCNKEDNNLDEKKDKSIIIIVIVILSIFITLLLIFLIIKRRRNNPVETIERLNNKLISK